MARMKYVVIDGYLCDEIYLFPEFVDYSEFVIQTLGNTREQVLGAGFVGSDLRCYGRSTSLGIDSRGAADTDLLSRNLGVDNL